jgi:hypothetical protein
MELMTLTDMLIGKRHRMQKGRQRVVVVFLPAPTTPIGKQDREKTSLPILRLWWFEIRNRFSAECGHVVVDGEHL